MATILECETLDYPGYFGPRITNFLLSITLLSNPEDEESEIERQSREHKVFERCLEFVAMLATVKNRMEISGHSSDAQKIEILLEMSTDNDLSDPDLREAFQRKADRLFA